MTARFACTTSTAGMPMPLQTVRFFMVTRIMSLSFTVAMPSSLDLLVGNCCWLKRRFLRALYILSSSWSASTLAGLESLNRRTKASTALDWICNLTTRLLQTPLSFCLMRMSLAKRSC